MEHLVARVSNWWQARDLPGAVLELSQERGPFGGCEALIRFAKICSRRAVVPSLQPELGHVPTNDRRFLLKSPGGGNELFIDKSLIGDIHESRSRALVEAATKAHCGCELTQRQASTLVRWQSAGCMKPSRVFRSGARCNSAMQINPARITTKRLGLRTKDLTAPSCAGQTEAASSGKSSNLGNRIRAGRDFFVVIQYHVMPRDEARRNT